MACMYPRHFPDLPLFWDDPSWADNNEEYKEAERVIENAADRCETPQGESLFPSNDDCPNVASQANVNNANASNDHTISNTNDHEDDDVDDDDDDDDDDNVNDVMDDT